jgi:hypothetical protein
MKHEENKTSKPPSDEYQRFENFRREPTRGMMSQQEIYVILAEPIAILFPTHRADLLWMQCEFTFEVAI